MMSITCAQELKFQTYVTPLTSQTNLVLRDSLSIRTLFQRPSHLQILFINLLKNDVCNIFFRFLLTVFTNMLSCSTSNASHSYSTPFSLLHVIFFSLSLSTSVCVAFGASGASSLAFDLQRVRKYFSSILFRSKKSYVRDVSVFCSQCEIITFLWQIDCSGIIFNRFERFYYLFIGRMISGD